jgi:hypothetical protein
MNNLDLLAARCAQETVNGLDREGAQDARKKAAALDNMATKALGVLQENGVYAGLLFLYAKGKDEYAQALRESLLATLAHAELASFGLSLPADKDKSQWQAVGEHLTSKVCNDLETLLLVKQVWEQMLIYVRYGAKARG